jgi:hypothetical protein
MAGLEELGLDPLVPPEVVLGGESLDERGDLSADRRPSLQARIDPLPSDEAAVPVALYGPCGSERRDLWVAVDADQARLVSRPGLVW